MDFILKRIENNLLLCDPGSYDYITCLRARIEYCLFLCLGFTWKNFDGIAPEKQQKIVSDLSNLSIGSTVAAIRDLDSSHKEVLATKKCGKFIDDYPSIRNKKMGHGYEMGAAIASALEPLYQDLIDNIPLLKESCDIIVIRRYNTSSESYEGIRFSSDANGQGARWSCPKELLPQEEQEFPRTYISYNDQYFKISPFVFIDPTSQQPFVFSSLTEKIIGKVKLCSLLPSISGVDHIELNFKELECLSKSDDGRQFSQSNGTIMNLFSPNYSQYVDVGFHKLIENFLHKNRAYVSATVWGHGGVGKTACIQKVCYDLFNSNNKSFSYIVFISAKDRVYNTKTGSIDSNTGNVRLYSEVIECITSVLFGAIDPLGDNVEKLSEYESRICNFEDSMLVVIDDYETFEDIEKEKISAFLSRLNAQYHKVIITTRNKRFVIGEAISCNELDIAKTKEFIESVVKAQYSDHYPAMHKLLADEDALHCIHKATSGRPIFIYQFIYIYIQKGYREKVIADIRSSPNAEEFLYGRIFDYLSTSAKYIFATISILTDNDLRFNLNVLEHVLSKAISDEDLFATSLEELSNQRVIELISEGYGRVYSQELLKIMSAQYQKFSPDFQSTVKNLLDGIGGKNITGSIFEAMLEQADKSRIFGNEKETTGLYRRVLNNENIPYALRKTALKHITDYLSNARLNIPSAICVMEEYLSAFADDAEIYTLYVYLLWSQGKIEKEKATNVIRTYFASENHKKTDPKNLTFFALGTGYCIDFDLQYREYPTESLRRAQLAKTFNEYGKMLFDNVRRRVLKGKPALFHNIRVALIQTVKLCCAMGKDGKNTDKINYGLTICQWMLNSNIKEPFLTQISRLEEDLKKSANVCGATKAETLPNLEPQIDTTQSGSTVSEDSIWNNGKQYSVGDVVDVKITRIMSYGAFASLDQETTGLIHISEIADRYIEDIFTEFTPGEICKAKVVAIEATNQRITLSTMDFRE